MNSRRHFFKQLTAVGIFSQGLRALGSKVSDQSVTKRSGSLPYILDLVHNNPGEPPFVTKFNDTATLKAWGYTGQCPKFYLPAAITYDAFDPTLLPAGSPERDWSVKAAKEIDSRIAAAATNNIPLYPFTDVLVVPRALMQKYGSEMRVNGRLSILKPTTAKVMRAQLKEIFDRFPTLGGITIRFGETYLQDTPNHVGGSPCSSVEEHIALVSLLREEVCDKRNKVVFYRTWEPTWAYKGRALHTDPGLYLELTNAVEPHQNLLFSIKHTGDDFLRDVPFNKTLAIGKHRQIVEVSCNQAGVYGKNAHPYYLGQGVIDGWEEMNPKRGIRDVVDSPQIAGLWTWTRGDGWAGPYIQNEFWVNLNAWVLSHFAQQPEKSEPEIFNDYCRNQLKLSPTDVPKFRELCLLATSATFHAQQTSVFYTDAWWCRDEYLTALDVLPVVNRSYAVGGITEVLAEKAKAVADWRRVEQLSREIHLVDPKDQEFLEVSSTYGRIKMAIIEQIWTMQILACSPAIDKAAMKRALTSYDALWAEWRDLKQAHACCPTLYREAEAVHIGPPLKPVIDSYRERIRLA